MIGVYKITNKINQKSYVGQSKNIQKRWSSHKRDAFQSELHTYEYPLYRAFRKYGIDNFEFSILELCNVADLDKRECYWIDYYDTIKNGYNQGIGGHMNFNRLNNRKLEMITHDIKDTSLSFLEIANKYHISYEMVTGINTGRYWCRDIEYPIRQTKKLLIKPKCVLCGKEIYKNATLCRDCCNSKQKSKVKPDKETLKNLIIQKSMIDIGKLFGVSDNAVRKWCYSYGLPCKYKDIQILKQNIAGGRSDI